MLKQRFVRRSCHLWAFLLGVGAAVTWSQEPILPREDLLTPSQAQINRAIDRGVTWLREQQGEDGSWGSCSGYRYGTKIPATRAPTGPTTFAVFTLRVCDVPRDDPSMKSGLKWLRRARRQQRRYECYESASFILMLTAFDGVPRRNTERSSHHSTSLHGPPRGSRLSARDWSWLREHVENLIGNRGKCCMRSAGGFGYVADRQDWDDISATSFCVLALRRASLAGFPVEHVRPDVWTANAEYLKAAQCSNGAFPYLRGDSWAEGATAASLAALLACRERTRSAGGSVPEWYASVLSEGARHLAEHFDVSRSEAESPPTTLGTTTPTCTPSSAGGA